MSRNVVYTSPLEQNFYPKKKGVQVLEKIILGK